MYATDTPVPGGSTAANLLAPGRTLQCRENNVRRGLAPEFEVVRLDRTTFSPGEEGVYGTYTPVPGGSSRCEEVRRS